MKDKKSLKGGACQSTGCLNNQRLYYSTQGKVQCNNAANRGGQVFKYLLPSSQKGGKKSYKSKNKYSRKKGGACQSTGCLNNQRLFYSAQGKVQCNNAGNRGGQVFKYLLPNLKGGNKSRKTNIKRTNRSVRKKNKSRK